MSFRPGLVLELGRSWGKSMCVFTEAAKRSGCRIISIGFDLERARETQTAPPLERVGGGELVSRHS